MPDIRYLKIEFSNELAPDDIPKFRAAVIEKTERGSPFFHNHQGESGFHYRYPLIQYKTLRRKACLLCLQEAIESVPLLFQEDMVLRIGSREEPFTVERLDMNHAAVDITEHPAAYRLRDWQALNQENYRKYLALPDQAARMAMLEKILTGHLLGFAQGIDWHVPTQLKVQVTKLTGNGRRRFKGQSIETFSLQFTANLSLPDFIGLGKGSSIGFGVVSRIREQPAEPASEIETNLT